MAVGCGGGSSKALVLMILCQIVYSATNVFYKLALATGMKLPIMIAYRLLFASAFTVPLALFLERKTRPKLSWMVLFQSFLSGLFGASLGQALILESLALTSATFAAAIPNLIPGTTFVLAILFGLEKLKLGTGAGKAKVVGTLVGIGGAMIFTFFKGLKLQIFSTHLNLLHYFHDPPAAHASHSHNQALGLLLALGSCLSYSLWLIIQAKMSKRYPAHYSSTALMCVMASLQTLIWALFAERDWARWRLGWDIRLSTVAFSGVMTSGVAIVFITIVVHERGPLFASVFAPLSLVMVAIVAALFLDECLTLGSFIGGVLIIGGLYAVLWGKKKEAEEMALLLDEGSKLKQAADSNYVANARSGGQGGKVEDNVAIDVPPNLSTATK